ncbi:MAG TPA: hypothetical protein VJM33_19050, partial [Microthrixaceae bacterium]|nr:hypothetical protein [Microthrixaceae bacterium]
VGFIAKLFQRGGTSVVVSRISFDAAIDAAQIFKGRTIAVGVNAETCQIDGAEVRLDQRKAPPLEIPSWADEVSSWHLSASLRSPGERAGWAYIVRTGRSVWEVRVAVSDDREVSEAELVELVESIGAAVAPA